MKFNEPFTLKDLAEAGYIMGLGTIGEVASHVECHYDAYWLIDDIVKRTNELNALIDGHEDDLIFKHLTPEDIQRMDDELEAAMAESPDAPPDSPEDNDR
jgi:hypothetical protein